MTQPVTLESSSHAQGTSRTRVLYSSTSYLPAIGGAQTHAHFIGLNLPERFDFGVATIWSENRTDWLVGTTVGAGESVDQYEVDNVPVTKLGFSKTDKLLMTPAVAFYHVAQGASIRYLSSIIAKKLRPSVRDVDLIHNGRIGREPLSYASLKVARERDIPFVFTPYHHPRWTGWYYRHYEELYRRSDAIIALTNAEKRLLVELGVRESRIYVAGMAPVLADQANPEEFREDLGIEGPIVLFLGQHFKYKGYGLVLDAAAQVWQKIPEVHFLFIGPAVSGSERAFERVADRRVQRLGTVDLQTKTDALAACTLLCLPSKQESFGGVYTEAWAMGKPVIGCPIPSVSEVVDHGENGLLVEPEVDQVGEAILKLLLDPEFAHRLGNAGRGKVAANYSWERIAGAVAEAYDRALH